MRICTPAGGGSTQLTVELDGERTSVEVDLDGGTITIGGRPYPFRVAGEKGGRLELEIDGNPIVIDGWPDGVTAPPTALAVDGEARTASVQVESTVVRRRAVDSPPPPATTARSSGLPAATRSAGPGDVVPPMPGRVVEVRVKVGDPVTTGQVVLVLEAMKMRNEVVAPIGGRVAEVSVQAGSSVRSRESMIRIQPES